MHNLKITLSNYLKENVKNKRAFNVIQSAFNAF